ncbi:MAG: rod shape-determining protein MreD [Eubacteriales bacterium]
MDQERKRTKPKKRNSSTITVILRNLSFAAIVVICFVLQSTLFHWLDFGGVIPNLLIIAVASIGFMRGKYAGILYGFMAGFLIDIFFGTVLGFYALIYMYIGYMNGFFERIFYPKDIKLPIILLITSNFLYSIVFYVLVFLLKGKFDFTYYLLNIIVPEMVYTIVIMIILYPCLLMINYKFDESVRRSARKFV